MNSQWLNIVGLVFGIVGSTMLSYGLFINKKDAIELGVSRFCGDSEEENLKLPQIQDRLKQSRNAKWGLFFLMISFILQIAANWPKS